MSWVDFFFASKKDIARSLRGEKTWIVIVFTFGAACVAGILGGAVADSSGSYWHTLNSWRGIMTFFPLGSFVTVILGTSAIGARLSGRWVTAGVAELARRWKLS